MKLMKAALRRLWRLRRATSISAGLAVMVALVAGVVSLAVAAPSPGCDEVPTGVATQDYWLRFNVPSGLMPDKQFDGLPAKLQVHRVRPVYANGKCPGVSTQAAVLIHGRTVPGPVVFDLRDPATGGGNLSVQEGLARAGIDTFTPSLLGYGRSTRFDEGLNDPGNASLRPYPPDSPTSCPYPEGCDRTLVPTVNPLDQQGTMLSVNPLAGERRAHSSNFRFARTDVWVRDIRQVIDDAIERAKLPEDEQKVALIAYSLGGQAVGRTLYVTRNDSPPKVSSVVFVNSLFVPNGPTEEPPTDRPTFPLTLTDRSGADANWRMPSNEREKACADHVIPGTQDQLWAQLMENDTVGREWGGDDPTHPTGLIRSPTFSGYGWNTTAAGQLTVPSALVIQGLEDTVLPPPDPPASGQAIYDALYEALPPLPPEEMPNKVLVEVQCASHALPWEGADSWAGPHYMLKKALIEWIKSGTFNGSANGRFIVDESGVARAAP